MMPMTRILSRELRGEFDGIATEGGTGEMDEPARAQSSNDRATCGARATSAPPEPL